MKNLLLLLSTLTFSFSTLYAQEVGPPSLTLGSQKVSYSKGTLDSELIQEIIASKQDEVKLEIAKSLILEKKLETNSYIFHDYILKTINTILNQRNPKVIKQEVLTQSVELIIPILLMELYLQDNTKNYQEYLLTSATKYNKSDFESKLGAKENSLELFKNLEFYEHLNAKDFIVVPEYLEKEINAGKELKKDKVFKDITIFSPSNVSSLDPNKVIDKVEIIRLSSDKNLTEEITLKRIDKDDKLINQSVKINEILIDLSLEACRKDTFLQSLGFFASFNEKTNKHENLYLQYVLNNQPVNLNFEGLFKEFENWKNVLLSNSYMLYLLGNELITKSELTKKINSISSIDINKNLKEIIDFIDRFSIDFDISAEDAGILLESFSKIINIDTSDFIANKYNKRYPLWHYELKENVYKNLKRIDLTYKEIELKEILDKISSTLEQIEKVSFKNIENNIRNSDTLRLNNYQNLLYTLNTLDHVESYEYIFKYLANLGEKLLKNEEQIKILNYVTNAVEKYTIFNSEENQVEIAIEDISVDIYKTFVHNQSRRLNLHFSVGYNTMFPSFSYKNDADKAISSISNVSEKIGVQFKLIDWYNKKGYSNIDDNLISYINNKPFIKNWHLIAYSSGILYNIDFLTSENGFNSPIFGISTGLTAFNNLDFNIGYALTSNFNIEEGFFNIGFDIKITEYLSKLSNKSRD